MIARMMTIRSGDTLPPHLPKGNVFVQQRRPIAHTCDQLGLCHHTDLDCNEGICHKDLLDDGHVDIPLPGNLPAMGGGNFWLDPAEDPNGVTPGNQQAHLTNVKSRPPSVGDFVYYWTPVFMVYLFCVALGGYIYARFFG